MTLVRMLLLLPLLALIGFEATLFTNFPFAWRLGGCPSAGLGACFPISYDWYSYAKDMVFYTLLGYWSVIVSIGVRQRLFTTPSTVPLWKRALLRGRFKLAFLGALLMLAAPLWAFPSLGSPGPGVACLTPSPCQTRADQLMAGWNLTITLWGYSTLLVMFVAPLGVVEDKWHQLLGASLIGLSGLYLAGLEAFFSTGAYVLFGLGQAMIGAVALTFGPLLVLSGGLLMITFRPKRQKLATGLLATEYQTLTPDQPKSLIASP